MILYTSIIKTAFEEAIKAYPDALANATSMQTVLFQGTVLDVLDYSGLENLKLKDTNLVLPAEFSQSSRSTNDPSIDWLTGNLDNPDLSMVELTADVAEGDVFARIDIVKGRFVEETRKALDDIGITTKFMYTHSSVDKKNGGAQLVLAIGQIPPIGLPPDLR